VPQAVIRGCGAFCKCSHAFQHAALSKTPRALADGLGHPFSAAAIDRYGAIVGIDWNPSEFRLKYTGSGFRVQEKQKGQARLIALLLNPEP
jgi:hypothetical protein